MLIEKYMIVDVELPPDDPYDPGELVGEEVYVSDSDIRHYIDTYLSAEDVLTYAKEIAPEEFEGNNSADLDLAYEILIDEFDEHNDINDLADLNEYIQDCVQRDYYAEAAETLQDKIENWENDSIENSHYIKANMPR